MEEFSNKTNELLKEKLDLFMDLMVEYNKIGCKINKARIDFLEESLPILREMEKIFKEDILYHRFEEKRKSHRQYIITHYQTDLERVGVSLGSLTSYIKYGGNAIYKFVPLMLMVTTILEFYDKHKRDSKLKD